MRLILQKHDKENGAYIFKVYKSLYCKGHIVLSCFVFSAEIKWLQRSGLLINFMATIVCLQNSTASGNNGNCHHNSFSWDQQKPVSLTSGKDVSLQWRRNGRDSVSNHQPHDWLLSRLFRCRSTKTSKLRVTGLCAGNSPVTGEFPAQMASYAENVSISWRYHVLHNSNYYKILTNKCMRLRTDIRGDSMNVSPWSYTYGHDNDIRPN